MRTLLAVFGGLLLISGAIGAQAQQKGVTKEGRPMQYGTAQHVSGQMPIKDGYMMKDGKMWRVKDGKSTAMDGEMTLSNGWKVDQDGKVTMSQGHSMKMKDGMALDETGKMWDKSGRAMDRDQMEQAYKSGENEHEARQGGASMDGAMMKNGKMWWIKNGKETEMTHPMTLENGWKVMPNGEVMMSAGKTKMMKDGMMLDMKGRTIQGNMMQKNEEHNSKEYGK